MRSYSVAIASLAIQAPSKWTDNLLTHYDIADVVHRRRGVSRGVSWPGLVRIALVRELHERLGCGVRDAVSLAGRLLSSPEDEAALGASVSLAFDRATLERSLRQRLEEALESAPTPRRGRPVAKGRAGG